LNNKKTNLPNYGSLEIKYKQYINPEEEQSDIELINT